MGKMGMDQRPGLRTLLVPRMLARGRTRRETAAITGVPRALVDLIAEQANPPVHRIHHPRPAHTSPVPALPPGRNQPGRTPQRNRDRQVRVLAFAIFAAGCAASIVLRAPLLPFAVMIAGSLAGSRLPAARKASQRPYHASGRPRRHPSPGRQQRRPPLLRTRN